MAVQTALHQKWIKGNLLLTPTPGTPLQFSIFFSMSSLSLTLRLKTLVLFNPSFLDSLKVNQLGCHLVFLHGMPSSVHLLLFLLDQQNLCLNYFENLPNCFPIFGLAPLKNYISFFFFTEKPIMSFSCQKTFKSSPLLDIHHAPKCGSN